MRKNRKKSPSMTSLRNRRDVQTLSMNCNSGNIDHPVRVLHLRYFHSFLHCQTQAPVVVQQRVSQPVQELHLKNLDGLLHSLHCATVSVKQLRHHSVEELKLRHLPVLDEILLELVADDHRDVHNQRPAHPPQPCPVFVSRPGLAASCSSRARASLHPRVCTATTASAYPGSVGTSTNWSAICGVQRTVRAPRGGHTILGTSITCSATRTSRGAKKSTNCSTICGTAS